jgi:hypothetical protein
MAHTKKGSVAPRFQPGDRVRGRSGVTVPGFEDIPLGGWAGTIEMSEQVDDQITYEIVWDRRTLDGMHPVYKNRCERDGLDPETMWLGEEDIEPDDGTPVPIEQPTAIQTPALAEEDEEDRVRAVFGLTHDDPLPEVGEETLLTYYRSLVARLKLPFAAVYGEEVIGPYSRKKRTITVTGLLDPEGYDLDEEFGLIGTGRDRDEEIEFPLDEIEVKKTDPNAKLLSDYSFWFHNWR